MQQGSVRLNKFISETGLCSRREADRFIIQGSVFINGRKAVVGDQVKVGDRVQVNGNELEPRRGEDIVFIALNKPVGIISTTEKGVRDNIVQFVHHSKRIFPIGRLDKDSQGLIFLTNNGDMVNKILRAGNKHEKEYVVAVNKPLTEAAIQGMANGVPILGVTTKKCKVIQEGIHIFRIILTQGLNRQIRRMCQHFGYEVTKLERVRIMNINLKGLPTGNWRDLTESEMSIIYEMVEGSSSEDVKKPKPTPAAKKVLKGNKEEGLSQKKSPVSQNSSSKRDGKSKISNKTDGKSRKNDTRSMGGNYSRKSGGGRNKS
ncbi:MAG: 23S rRNA pseudouridine(2604) synthase RluF [Anditalea sp.]